MFFYWSHTLSKMYLSCRISVAVWMKLWLLSISCLSAQIYPSLYLQSRSGPLNIFPLTPGLMLSFVGRGTGHTWPKKGFPFWSAHLAVSYSMGGGWQVPGSCSAQQSAAPRTSSFPCFQQLHNWILLLRHFLMNNFPSTLEGQISRKFFHCDRSYFSVIP